MMMNPHDMHQAVAQGNWRDTGHAEEFTAWFIHRIQQAEFYMDVGAGYGFYAALAMKHMLNRKQLWFIEPDPQRRCVLSQFIPPDETLDILDLALWHESEILTFYLDEQKSLSTLCDSGTPIQIQTTPLDALELEQLDLIKIDVEGAEANVISGMRKTLQRFKPEIFLEFHPWIDDVTPNGRAIISQTLIEEGYDLYRCREHSIEKTTWVGGRMYAIHQSLNTTPVESAYAS